MLLSEVGCVFATERWKGVTFLVRAKPTKGGGEILIFLTDEDRKRLERLI